MKKTNIYSLGLSTIFTFIFITFMTIYAEINTSFKDFLKLLTGHHWTSKGIISVIFFILLYFILKNFTPQKKEIVTVIYLVMITAIFCTLVIFGFFIYEFF